MSGLATLKSKFAAALTGRLVEGVERAARTRNCCSSALTFLFKQATRGKFGYCTGDKVLLATWVLRDR